MRLRAERLGDAALDVPMLAATDLDTVLDVLEAERPQACVVDSIQTIASPGAQAVRLTGGAGSAADVLAQVGNGIVVSDVQGLHSGVNPVSGDFSTGIEGVRLVNGELGETAVGDVGVRDDHAAAIQAQRRDADAEPALLRRRMAGVLQAEVGQPPFQDGQDARLRRPRLRTRLEALNPVLWFGFRRQKNDWDTGELVIIAKNSTNLNAAQMWHHYV